MFDEWERQTTFSLSPSYSTRTEIFRGFCVSWGLSSRFYIPLPPKPTPLPTVPSSLPPRVFSTILSFLQGPIPQHYDFEKTQEEVWGGGMPVLTLGKGKGMKGVSRGWRAGYREWECLTHSSSVGPRWELIKSLLSRGVPRRVVVWDVEQVVRELTKGHEGDSWLHRIEWQDPGVALWLLDPDSPQPPSLDAAIENWNKRARGGSGAAGQENPAAHTVSEQQTVDTCPEDPSCVKSALLMHVLEKELVRLGLYRAFKDIEMPTRVLLACAKGKGALVDVDCLSQCVTRGEERCESLEKEGCAILSSSTLQPPPLCPLPPDCLTPCGTRLRCENVPALTKALYKCLGAASSLSAASSLITTHTRTRMKNERGGDKITGESSFPRKSVRVFAFIASHPPPHTHTLPSPPLSYRTR